MSRPVRHAISSPLEISAMLWHRRRFVRAAAILGRDRTRLLTDASRALLA
jgi:hypothetical protein